MTKPIWTYTSDACGYMLFKNGEPQRGARTLGTRTHTANGKRKHWRNVRADIKMHSETANRICDQKNRLEYLRGELRAERISYDELHELQSLARHIEPGDTELLEAAGVPEKP